MSEPYEVVVQVPQAEREYHEAALRNVRNIVADLGEDTRVAVVTHGPGLRLVTGGTGLGDAVADLVAQGVEVLACRNTMQRLEVTDVDLLPGVGTVSSGLGEIVRRQRDGWAYVRP